MQIRAATVDDAVVIAEVHVRSWQVAYAGMVPQTFLDSMSAVERAPLLAAHLRSADALGLLVAVDDERAGEPVVGFVATGPSRDDDATADTAEITALYVRPDVWRTGAGRHLGAAAVGRMREAGATTATLWVLAANRRARRFYESTGWSVDGTERNEWIGGRLVPEVRFRRAITST